MSAFHPFRTLELMFDLVESCHCGLNFHRGTVPLRVSGEFSKAGVLISRKLMEPTGWPDHRRSYRFQVSRGAFCAR